MSLHPVPARWFEALVARRDCTLALEVLARTGAIALEMRMPGEALAPVAELREGLEEYRRFSRQYGAYWPPERLHPAPLPASPRDTLERALVRMRAWAREAEPLIRQLQEREATQSELRLWRDLFGRLADSNLDFSALAEAGPALAAYVALLPPGSEIALPAPAVVRRCRLGDQDCMLALVPAGRVAGIRQQVAGLKGRCVGVPSWVQPRARDNLYGAALQLAALNAEIARLRGTIQALYSQHGLAKAVNDILRLEWLITEVQELPATDNFAWITGWTSDLQGRRLSERLQRTRVRALLHFPAPPAEAAPPLLLQNPWWARPFELFARTLGMPARHEADPSTLLAFVVPLLFGYMFGDLGQGAVLAGAGLLLQRRWPVARLLVAGGLMSMVFGLLFGSVFGLEHWIPALWVHPLEAPLLVLAVPLVGGVVLLALGMMLDGLEAHWAGRGRHWWLGHAGLVLAYLGVISGLAHPAGWTLAVVGAIWHGAGQFVLQRRPLALLIALGELAEEGLRLLVNTLSFARLGAFALAHAGLSLAISSLAAASGSVLAAILILVLGNAVVIAIEGMVVSIQTTRLVLFEFFLRFLRGEGRAFEPLPLPPAYYQQGELHEPAR